MPHEPTDIKLEDVNSADFRSLNNVNIPSPIIFQQSKRNSLDSKSNFKINQISMFKVNQLDITDLEIENEDSKEIDSLTKNAKRYNSNPLSISSTSKKKSSLEQNSDELSRLSQHESNNDVNDVFNFNNLHTVVDIEHERYEYKTNGRIIMITFFVLVILFLLDIIYRIFAYFKDRDWTIFMYILISPFIFLIAFSFFNFIVFGLKNIFFSVDSCKVNSTYYSCYAPKIPANLPHVTIQIPIYKESFETIIIPSLKSLMRAMEFYRNKHGCSNIYVNDDGFAFLSDDEKLKRITFYTENNIGWIARPTTNRCGRFKKGSNMNYAIHFSKKYSELLLESTLENSFHAMKKTLEHYNNECSAGGDVTLGDLILLVDSDTVIPLSCIYDTVGEFSEKNLAFTQHLTTPLLDENVNGWDLTISHFTKMIYELAFIQVTAGGDPSPLVGHNAFIRKQYLEKVAIREHVDHAEKYWNENTVCEDFDLSLRFQSAGYYGRYISYTGKDFKEGISPTYCDEIVRFKKYALGTAEITFNKISDWCCKGIFSPTIKSYIGSKMIPWYSKILLLSYLCSYFIMAFAPLLLIAITIQSRFCDNCNTRNIFDIMVGLILIFSCLLPFTTALYRYKLNCYTTIEKLIVLRDEYWYGFKMGLFFGSICTHMLFSVLTYMFGFDEVFLSSRKEKPTCGKMKEFKYIIISYWNVFMFVIIFEALFVCNYLYGYASIYTLVTPTMFVFLHIAIPFIYS